MTTDYTGKYVNLKMWELVTELPPGRVIIKGKWIFSVKLRPDRSVERFKARWVGCGYSQINGVDYKETFCSTLRLEALRTFLAAACAADDNFLEMDVVKAFPSGECGAPSSTSISPLALLTRTLWPASFSARSRGPSKRATSG